LPQTDQLAGLLNKYDRDPPRAVHDLTGALHDLDRPRWRALHSPHPLDRRRFDGKALKLSVAGIAAGRTTRGHRFLGSSTVP